ncbi:MAG TPA: lamin tail domain-containing protein [Candidatus Saccharimonadales bacterium]|nr:lamin tail domain-containing protein [Candidatus Saccharimonadales bacterium]
MKRVVAGVILACLIGLIRISGAAALTVIATPPDKPESPLIVTAYQVTGANLNLVQIYNSSDQLIDLSGWRIEVDYTDSANQGGSMAVDGLTGWLEPGRHLLAVDDRQVIDGPAALRFDSFNLDPSLVASQLILLPPEELYQPAIQPIDDVSSKVMLRGLTSSGNYSSSENFDSLAEQPGRLIFSDQLYQVPTKPQVKIIEILAHSADCAPDDTSLACGDYVKLYNPTNQALDLSGYNLRTNFGGADSSISNTVWLGGYQSVEPHGYVTVYLRDDKEKLNLTNSGGYVWLTDVYGVKRYDETITKYTDAGSSDYQGWSWALNPVTGKWQWTSTPRPTQANHFELPEPPDESIETSDLKPCAPNQFRNPATNRCKLKLSVTSQLKPCDANEFRNPATNRCKDKVSSSSSYVPCDAGEKRNPKTHRCRSVLAAETSYVPCDPGEERNPATHRCRQVVGNPATQVGAVSPDQIINQSPQADYGNLILAGTGAVVAGYGLFEWRKELFDLGRKAFGVLGRK